MQRKYCYFYLTCDEAQIELIAKTLLEKKLVACAKFVPVESMYWWQEKIERGDEILIVMESAEDLFAQVEAEVAKVHSYETFVLTQIPIKNINHKATRWLEENLSPVNKDPVREA